MKQINQYLQALVDPKLAPTAIKVALVVGSILFAINHGTAVLKGNMNRNRWSSGLLTYLVPYCVNIHGQYVSSTKIKRNSTNK